jgi:hypothetical protein
VDQLGLPLSQTSPPPATPPVESAFRDAQIHEILPQARAQRRLTGAIGARDDEQRWIHSADSVSGPAANCSISSARKAAIFAWMARSATWFRAATSAKAECTSSWSSSSVGS